MKTPTSDAVERRYTTGQVRMVEKRADDAADAPSKVRGYAALFGVRSSNMGSDKQQFFEVIEKGAFDDVLKDDVRCLFNHDANLILARSKNGTGTLSIGVDDVGLWYEFTTPDTTCGEDLVESLRRGDVDQSSFGFTVSASGQKWEETASGDTTTLLRTITKISRLYDVSPVTYPAYPDTAVALRSFEANKPDEKPANQPEANQDFPIRSLWAARLGLRN